MVIYVIFFLYFITYVWKLAGATLDLVPYFYVFWVAIGTLDEFEDTTRSVSNVKTWWFELVVCC